ncbi:MAG: hypothetical protein HYV97_12140 [Bdellovibrio sp.]|nr:hypothetical protein [Bdellovibrio sp.]
MYILLFLVMLSLIPKTLFALSEVGLSPSVGALSRAETMTASTPPGEALFYNPAHLAWKGVALEILATGYVVDEDHAKQGEEIVKDKRLDSTQLIGNALSSDKPALVKSDVEFLNFIFPYFAFKSFANARLLSRKINDSNPHQEIDFLSRFGLTSGLALSFRHWSIGYSYYVIKQADLFATPNEAEMATITQAAQDGTLSSETTNFGDFTSLNYGEASGHNVGLSYRSSRINSSGFGIAVLNAGGTKFNSERPIIRGKFEEIEQTVQDEARKHNLTLGTPREIKQMVNTGINLATDEGKENYFHASFAIDYQDIGGTTLDNHTAMAGRVGFRVDDTLSLITSIPIAKHKDLVYFLGLTGLDLVSGYRVEESLSAGVDLKLHLGINKLVSLVRINLNGMIIKSLDENLIPDATGFRLGLGLTFVFPDLK